MNMLDEYDWIASPRNNTPTNRPLIDRRADIIVFGVVNDAEASYSFDDYALIRLDDAYYLLRTSGCSCPNPCEEWGIAFGPCTLSMMRRHLEDEGKVEGFGVTNRQHDDFLTILAIAEAEVRP